MPGDEDSTPPSKAGQCLRPDFHFIVSDFIRVTYGSQGNGRLNCSIFYWFWHPFCSEASGR
jgi:hypothetical protein